MDTTKSNNTNMNDFARRLSKTYQQCGISWDNEGDQERIINDCYTYSPNCNKGTCRACGSQSLLHRDTKTDIAIYCPIITNQGVPLEKGLVARIKANGNAKKETVKKETKKDETKELLERVKELERVNQELKNQITLIHGIDTSGTPPLYPVINRQEPESEVDLRRKSKKRTKIN